MPPSRHLLGGQMSSQNGFFHRAAVAILVTFLLLRRDIMTKATYRRTSLSGLTVTESESMAAVAGSMVAGAWY